MHVVGQARAAFSKSESKKHENKQTDNETRSLVIGVLRAGHTRTVKLCSKQKCLHININYHIMQTLSQVKFIKPIHAQK